MDKKYKNLVKAHIIAVSNKSLQLWTECENLRKFIDNIDVLDKGLIVEYNDLLYLENAMQRHKKCIDKIKEQLENYYKAKEQEEEQKKEIELETKGMAELTAKVLNDIIKIMEDSAMFYPAKISTIKEMINIYTREKETELENKISLESFFVTEKGYDLKELKGFIFRAYNCAFHEKSKIKFKDRRN